MSIFYLILLNICVVLTIFLLLFIKFQWFIISKYSCTIKKYILLFVLSPCKQSEQGGSKFNLKKKSTHPVYGVKEFVFMSIKMPFNYVLYLNPLFCYYIQLHLVCQLQRVYFSIFVFSFIYLSDRVVLLTEQHVVPIQ